MSSLCVLCEVCPGGGGTCVEISAATRTKGLFCLSNRIQLSRRDNWKSQVIVLQAESAWIFTWAFAILINICECTFCTKKAYLNLIFCFWPLLCTISMFFYDCMLYITLCFCISSTLFFSLTLTSKSEFQVESIFTFTSLVFLAPESFLLSSLCLCEYFELWFFQWLVSLKLLFACCISPPVLPAYPRHLMRMFLLCSAYTRVGRPWRGAVAGQYWHGWLQGTFLVQWHQRSWAPQPEPTGPKGQCDDLSAKIQSEVCHQKLPAETPLCLGWVVQVGHA